MADKCGYELPTNLQNFMLNQSENIPKSFRGGATFLETPCRFVDSNVKL